MAAAAEAAETGVGTEGAGGGVAALAWQLPPGGGAALRAWCAAEDIEEIARAAPSKEAARGGGAPPTAEPAAAAVNGTAAAKAAGRAVARCGVEGGAAEAEGALAAVAAVAAVAVAVRGLHHHVDGDCWVLEVSVVNEGYGVCLELSGALSHPSMPLEAEASVLGALPPSNLNPDPDPNLTP